MIISKENHTTNNNDKKNKNQKQEKTKTYLIILIIIGICLAFFSIFFLKNITKVYGMHYFEYYNDTNTMYNHLKNTEFKEFITYNFNLPDKIIGYRGLLFFTLFGASEINFFFSSFFLNYILLIILFLSLKKIMKEKESFLFTLLILTSYFFLYLLTSFYIDLTFFLLCGIFYIYIYLFEKNYKENKYILAILTFLLFFTKNATYSLMIGLIPTILFYFIFSKKKEDKLKYSFHFLFQIFIGFLFYFILIFKFNLDGFLQEIIESTIYNLPGFQTNIISIPYLTLLKNIIIHLPKNMFYFLFKFPKTITILLLYTSICYFLYKKEEKFMLFLFFWSEIYLFIFFNIKNYSIRYFLQFYFIYLYFIFKFIISIFKKISSKHYFGIMFFFIGIFFMITFYTLITITPNFYYGLGTEYRFLSKIPSNSTIYLEKIKPQDNNGYLEHELSFRYSLTKNITKADYVICSNCENLTTNFTLIYDHMFLLNFYKRTP